MSLEHKHTEHMKLLTTQNAKTVKGEALGYHTAILYLAPASVAGMGNVCPKASKGCREACLYTAGMGGFSNVQNARIAKTKLFFAGAIAFVDTLKSDIAKHVRKASKLSKTPAIRLNGTSDLPWEKLKGSNGKTCMEEFPGVQFYDYTKILSRMKPKYRVESIPNNYMLVFSRSESNESEAWQVISWGGSVAMVFDTKKGEEFPKLWKGNRLIDGDKHDLRFLEPGNSIIGLRAKGDARKDKSGFVTHIGESKSFGAAAARGIPVTFKPAEPSKLNAQASLLTIA